LQTRDPPPGAIANTNCPIRGEGSQGNGRQGWWKGTPEYRCSGHQEERQEINSALTYGFACRRKNTAYYRDAPGCATGPGRLAIIAMLFDEVKR
jgi:hypothetical protein